MKLTLSATELLKAVSFAGKVVKPNAAQPILENLCMVARNDKLYVKATDLNATLICHINVPKIDGEWRSFLIPSEPLAKLLRTMNSKESKEVLTITVGEIGNELHLIRWSSGKQKLPGADPELFPARPKVTNEWTNFTYSAEHSRQLIDALSFCLFACSTDDIKPAFLGITVSLWLENITVSSTNGFTLASSEIKGVGFIPDGNFILPKSFVSTLVATYSEEPGELTLLVSDRLAQFAFGPYMLSCSLVDEKPLQFSQVIDHVKQNQHQVSFSRVGMLSALSRVVLTTNQHQTVSLTVLEGAVSVEATNDGKGTHTVERVPYLDFSAETQIMHFNGGYLRSVLSNTKGESVTMHYGEPNKPALLTGEDANSLSILGPVNAS